MSVYVLEYSNLKLNSNKTIYSLCWKVPHYGYSTEIQREIGVKPISQEYPYFFKSHYHKELRIIFKIILSDGKS